jgi:putative DNA primase/helicase
MGVLIGLATPDDSRRYEGFTDGDDVPEPFISKSDEDLAYVMEKAIGGQVRYSRQSGGWYAWRDFYWSDDEAQAYNVLARKARRLIASYKSEEKAKALATLLDVRKQHSVMEVLSRQDSVRLKGDEFDQVGHLIACQNGVIDLQTGTFRTTGDPADLVTKRANVKWDPTAECPRFWSFLLEIMSGDEDRALYLLSILGYALFGSQREQKFWLFVGKLSGNGKGTLMRVIDWLLGDYSHWPDRSLYMQPKHGENAQAGNPAVVKLQGVRFLPMSEPGGGHFNDEMIKAHTGDDPITARSLYSNVMLTFRPTHTIILACNDAPRVSDVGGAMRRRVRVLPFNEKFGDTERDDKDLEAKLRAEGPGIFRLLVGAAARYHADGLHPEPKDVTVASDAYIEANDSLADFIDEACSVEAKASETAKRMHEAYVDWCKLDTERVALDATTFGTLLSKRFEKRRVGQSKTQTYLGIRTLRTDELADRGVDFDHDQT